jgi:ELWxxDGT repeat protein
MIRGLVVAMSLWVFGGVLPGAAQPRLVRDIDPGSVDPQREGAGISGLTSIGARAVFLLQRTGEADSGSELWATDGTDGGTERLRSFFGLDTSVVGSNGRIAFLFVAVPSSPGPASTTLWRTDGTVEGTLPLGRFAASGETAIQGDSLVFAGCATATDCEPWASDGTAGGTRRLRDITPGSYGSGPNAFLPLGDRLYFLATAPDGPGLWQTDLTRRGTRRVARLPPYGVPRELTAAGSRLFFILGDENSLWTSDGTAAGTAPVAPFDRPRGRGPAVSRLLGAVGELEYFEGTDPALGPQLYRTDGTPGGTRRLTAFPPSQQSVGGVVPLAKRLVFLGPDGKIWTSAGSRASTHPLTGCAGGCPGPYFNLDGLDATESGGLAFFSGNLGSDIEPWVTDGTPEGTRRLLQVCAADCLYPPFFGPTIHGRLLFEAAQDLWSTDGTPAGTRRVGEGILVPDEGPLQVAAAGSRLVFSGFDRSAPDGTLIPQLKSVEGPLRSERVLDLHLTDGLSSNPQGFTALGDDVLFFACSPTAGGIWKTRGTPETTVRLTDSQGFCGTAVSQTFTVVGGIAYFAAFRSGDFWTELWRTDGTPEGTWQITHVGPEKYVPTLTAFRGRVAFVAMDSDGGGDPTLWTSDGTAAGTAPLAGLPARNVFNLQAFADALYFNGEDLESFNDTLFRSDGTAAGTIALFQSGGDPPARFLDFGGQLFIVDSGALWKTDGTVEGTRALSNPNGEAQPPLEVLDLARFGDRLYFTGLDLSDPNNFLGAPALFRTDGTEAATVRLRTFDLDPTFETPLPYFPRPQFTELAGALFFVAYDLEHGGELWRTDGTAAGTSLVSDLDPGPASARISGLTAAAGRLFFAADDGEHGVELWTSDGTAAGTRRLSDLAAGPPSSSPRELAAIGAQLFFSADDGVTGREPWVLPLDSVFAGRSRP